MIYNKKILKCNGSELVALHMLLREWNLENTDLFQEIDINLINYPYILDSQSKIIIDWNLGRSTFLPSRYGSKYDGKTNL